MRPAIILAIAGFWRNRALPGLACDRMNTMRNPPRTQRLGSMGSPVVLSSKRSMCSGRQKGGFRARSLTVPSTSLRAAALRAGMALMLAGLLLSGGLVSGTVLSGAALVSPAVPPDPSLAGTLRGVENKYNRLKTVRLRFQQIYRQNRQVLRREEGTLYLRKPGRMRWEYEEIGRASCR